MSIFQKSIVKKHISSINQELLKEKWNLFTSYFHNATIQENIHNSKEEQFQEGFLRELFVKVLGYTLNPEPNFNLTTEYKNIKDSKKADGAIIINDIVTAVIELKGTGTTDLGKVESQAFNYKNNQHKCVYVITSNFEKLRFYIDNAIEHIEFNLFKLTEEEFQLLYLCLAFKNIENNVPKNIKDESVSQEDVITKKLYNDYSLFKRELHHNLVALNPGNDPLELFQKSQKLLDRFLFIFFAEDRGLLPTNLIFRINKEWQQLREMRIDVSLYDRYKIYFSDLNVGAKVSLPAFSQTASNKKDEFQIYAYNGGLFKEDDELNKLKIDDALLYKHTEKISNYDFASEVDVNILGHIFENSLNELDEIKAQIEGQEIDKTNTKRKKDGVFYTPKYITKYIVDNTVGKLCIDKKVEFKIIEEEYITDKKRNKTTIQNLATKLTNYRNWLLQITICDPACGSGAFLNQALDFLINEHKYIDELQAKLFGDALILSDVEQSILENNVFGVDINEESVEIAKLSLWLRTAQPNRKLNDLNSNIKCGNSLIDDVSVAGDKAFNWEQQFTTVFENGGFDIIIGNPPYVLCQPSNTDEQTLDFYKKFEVASYKIDLFHLFFEASIKHLKEKGKLGFITPNTYLTNKYIQKMRNYILNNTSIETIVNYEDEVFFDASVDVATIILKKERVLNENIEVCNYKLGVLEKFGSKKQIDWLNESENTFNIKKELEINFVNCVKFEEIGNSYFGIQAYDRKTSISDFKENDEFLQMIDGAEINRYELSNPNKFFNFIPANIKSGGDYSVYSKLRIVVRQIGQTPIIGICEPGIVTSNTLYNLYLTDDNYSLKYVLAIFNSKLIKKYWLSNYSDSKQLFPKIKGYQLKQLPIKVLEKELQSPFIEKADLMLALNTELRSVNNKFTTYFSGQYKIEKLNNKLELWYTLEFANFITELNKAIKTVKGLPLTKKDEFDWIDLFNENKQKAQALKSQIDVTDKEIDQMVYKLYDLTEEEIKIVEA
jgi:type I restriction-modification system DNA methylase subunit